MIPISGAWTRSYRGVPKLGGGGGNPTLPSVTAATPPVTESSAQVVQAQQDLRRQSLKKRGFSSTIFAGDTGGWSNPANPTPSPTNPKQTMPGAKGASKTLGS